MDPNRTFMGFLISFVFGCFFFTVFVGLLSSNYKSSSFDLITNLWLLLFLTLLIPATQFWFYKKYKEKDKAFAKGIFMGMALELGLCAMAIMVVAGF